MESTLYIRSTLLLTGLLWVLAMATSAQEEEEAHKDLPSLDLPSVEIYGKERIDFSIEEDKQTESRRFTFPVDLKAEMTRERGPAADDRSPKITPQEERGRTPEGVATVRAEAGSFSSWAGLLRYANRGGPLGYLLELHHQMSDGHVDSVMSAHRTTGLGAKGVFAAAGHTRIPVEMYYENGTQELWGAASPFERSGHLYRGEIGLDLFNPEGTRAELRLGAASGKLEDDGGGKAEESTLYARLGTSVRLGDLLLNGAVGYSDDDLSRDAGTEGNNRLLEARAEGRFSIGARMTVGMGARFFHTSTREDTSAHKIYPWAEMVYTAASWLKVYGRYDPRVLRTSLLDLYTHVPPIDLEGDLLPKEDELRGEVGTEIGGDRVHLRLLGRIERGETRIWTPGGTGLWQLDRNDRAEVRSAQAICRMALTRYMRLSGWGTIRDAVREETNEDVPYVPASEAGAGLEFGPAGGFRAKASFQWIGERPTDGAGTELDPYAALSVHLSKALGDHVTVFARGTNLLDDEHEIWRGYVEPGRAVYGGLEATW